MYNFLVDAWVCWDVESFTDDVRFSLFLFRCQVMFVLTLFIYRSLCQALM